MRKKLIVRIVLATFLLVSTVSLGLLVTWESPAQAAPPDKQKVVKLRIDGTRWHKPSQRFIVDLSCQAGIANAGDKNKNFLVSTELRVSGIGNKDIVLTRETDLTKPEGATPEPDEYGMVPIESQYISWDRDGGTFTGTAYVTTTVEVKNHLGHSLWNPVSEFNPIYIEAP